VSRCAMGKGASKHAPHPDENGNHNPENALQQ
jgi:hypothetical protein